MTLISIMIVCGTSSATAASEEFNTGIHIYEDHHGWVYTTTWIAYPMTIKRYIDNSDKPAELLVALTADGKMSFFRGIISLNCLDSNPAYSEIVSSEEYIGLDDAIRLADDFDPKYGIPRPVVNNLFNEFCK